MSTDGNASEILRIADGRLHMEGMSVILQAVRKIPTAITKLLERNSLPASEIGTVLMHQANLNLIDRLAQGGRNREVETFPMSSVK